MCCLFYSFHTTSIFQTSSGLLGNTQHKVAFFNVTDPLSLSTTGGIYWICKHTREEAPKKWACQGSWNFTREWLRTRRCFMASISSWSNWNWSCCCIYRQTSFVMISICQIVAVCYVFQFSDSCAVINSLHEEKTMLMAEREFSLTTHWWLSQRLSLLLAVLGSNS